MDYDFGNIKLTDKQKYFLKMVMRRIDEGNDYFYCEVGDCKPWDNRTVSSLEHRGIIKFMEGGDTFINPGGVYFIALGLNFEKQKREDKLKIILG